MAKQYNYVLMVHMDCEDYPEQMRRFVKLDTALDYLDSWIFKRCIYNHFFHSNKLTIERVFHGKPFKKDWPNGYKLSEHETSANYYWIEPL